jgi:formate hydrogenlyase subunit 4
VIAFTVATVVGWLLLPLVVPGLMVRVKSRWASRRGAPILQLAYDLRRLLRKRPLASATATPLFSITPYAGLAAAFAAAAIAPLLGGPPLASCHLDLIWLAYAWGLGRVALMLGALDTGSSFEGMGAAREALFASLLEPGLLVVVGALALVGHADSLSTALTLHPRIYEGGALLAWIAAVIALVVVVQVEAARIPVDDPTTHLELTMIHEVMVLDHSGPELAAIQLAAGVKLTCGIALIATLLNPFSGEASLRAAAANLGLIAAVTIGLGTIESLIARLRMRTVPQYIAVALIAGAVALLATAWHVDPAPGADAPAIGQHAAAHHPAAEPAR